MASHDQQLRNPRYRDWVKAGLALKYLKDGIQEFVDGEIKDQQMNILEEVQKEIGRPGATCNSCPIDQLLAHKRGRYKKGNFCPYDICDKFFDKIVEQHMYGRPSWSNSDSTKWCTDYWEIAKCFIDGGGYADKISAADTDCKGLLSIITNSMFVQRNVDTPIDRFEPKTDVFSKSKEARNEILHLASLQLPVETLNNYVDVMIRLLEDKGKLYEHDNAKEAISKLRQLKETDLYISTENEWEIRESALKAIQERKLECLDEIEKKQDEILEKLQIDKIQETLDELSKTSKETSQSFSGRQGSLEQRQTVLESTLKQTMKLQKDTSKAVVQLQQDVANLKKDLSDLKHTFDEIEMQHKKRAAYLDHKKVVRQELFNMYSKYLSKIPVPPLLRKLDATVDEFYIELEICDDLVYANRSNENNHYRKPVTNYHEIFNNKGNRVENIYVLGDAGVGKTTWCLKLINVWLEGLTKQQTEATHSLSPNEKMMLEFDLVLFVSLRHASKDVNLKDMIRKQIFHQTPQLFENMQEVINIEPDKCLVIADGLDEWNAPTDEIVSNLGNDPSFPSRYNMNHCTVITTTRPWKLNEVQPSNSEIDRAVMIRGFDERKNSINCLAEKVINKLNKKVSCDMSSSVRKERKVANFLQELDRISFFGVMKIPLIFIFMIVKWFNDGSLESTMAGNYSFMLKSFLEHEEGYRNIKTKYGRKQKFDGRLSCVSYIEEAKLEWSTDAEKLPECVKKHTVCCQYSRLILKLAEIAFEGLFDRNNKALIFSEESLLEKLSSDEIEVAVKSGILSTSDVVGHCYVSKLSFLHKTLQEFLAAIHLVTHYEDDACISLKQIEKYCSNYGRIDEMKNVILFISGFDTNLAIKILKHLYNVEDQSCFHLFRINFSDFVVKCIMELREVSSFASLPMVPLSTFILTDMKRFDVMVDLLETSIDKGSVKYVEVNMYGEQGLGPNRLLDILSSQNFPLFSLTTLELTNISEKHVCISTNRRVVFNLQCLKDLKLRHINTKNVDEERSTNFVLDFSHSRNILSVKLDSLLACQINFSGKNLRELAIEQLEHCHVKIKDDVALHAAKKSQTLSGEENDPCTNVNCNCKQNCSEFCIYNPIGCKKTSDTFTQITSLTCRKNKFCEVEVDPNISIESVVLVEIDIVPKISWKDVKRVILIGASIGQKKCYIDVLTRIRFSKKLTSLHYSGCDQIVISDLVKTVESAKNLRSLGIINRKETLHIDNDSFNFHQIKHVVVKGSGVKILSEKKSWFSSVETLELFNMVSVPKFGYDLFGLIPNIEEVTEVDLPQNGIKSVRSLVNLKCLKCEWLTEGDFVILGECFQYLSYLEELELSCFWWHDFQNPSLFSCLKNIENLKTLSLRDCFQNVMSAISMCLPNLDLSELLLESYFPVITQFLNNMHMLKKLTFTRTFNKEFLDFIGLRKNLKQIVYLIILKPVQYLDGHILDINNYVIEKIDLSVFSHLKYFSLEDVHICPGMWQTFVSRLPKNGQLETLEFPNALVRDEATEQMIMSTPGFKCQKWECVGYNKYNIILKASGFVIYDRTDLKERK